MRSGADMPDRMDRIRELADVIVIDEAHHFRNRGLANTADEIRSRYWKLYSIAQGKEVFLLTATPVNNHLTDLQHLIELFSRVESSCVRNYVRHSFPPGGILQKNWKSSCSRSRYGASHGELFESNEVEAEKVLF